MTVRSECHPAALVCHWYGSGKFGRYCTFFWLSQVAKPLDPYNCVLLHQNVCLGHCLLVGIVPCRVGHFPLPDSAAQLVLERWLVLQSVHSASTLVA